VHRSPHGTQGKGKEQKESKMETYKKEVRVWITIDEIVDRLEFNEQRLIIKPVVGKLIEYYDGLYAGAVNHEKEFKKKGDEHLTKWQGKRKKALKEILKVLTEILVQLDKLNEPLKSYHNNCMGFQFEVKT